MQIWVRYISSHGKATIALLLAGLILLLDAMAACPALHELIHHDADKPGHHCAVTVLAQGKVDSASVDVPIPPPPVSVEFSPQILVSIPHTLVAALPPDRGPPACCFNS